MSDKEKGNWERVDLEELQAAYEKTDIYSLGHAMGKPVSMSTREDRHWVSLSHHNWPEIYEELKALRVLMGDER